MTLHHSGFHTEDWELEVTPSSFSTYKELSGEFLL